MSAVPMAEPTAARAATRPAGTATARPPTVALTVVPMAAPAALGRGRLTVVPRRVRRTVAPMAVRVTARVAARATTARAPRTAAQTRAQATAALMVVLAVDPAAAKGSLTVAPPRGRSMVARTAVPVAEVL